MIANTYLNLAVLLCTLLNVLCMKLVMVSDALLFCVVDSGGALSGDPKDPSIYCIYIVHSEESPWMLRNALFSFCIIVVYDMLYSEYGLLPPSVE